MRHSLTVRLLLIIYSLDQRVSIFEDKTKLQEDRRETIWHPGETRNVLDTGRIEERIWPLNYDSN